MRGSRFLIIIIIISVFAILASVFFFVRNKKEGSDELTNETVIQDDFNSSDSVSVDKQVEMYDESTAISTDITDEAVDATEVDIQQETVTDYTSTVEVQSQLDSEPKMPTLTNAPYSTSKDSESIEVNGEADAEIFVNEWSMGKLDASGKKTISLNTAGGDGDKSFAIFLKNSAGKSGTLNLVIKKITANTIAATSSATSTVTSPSANNSWSYIYTNKEKFDIDDYKDDDIDELKLNDVCRDNKGAYTYCYKTRSLGDSDNSNLGNTKCPASCSTGQTCLLWNKEEKSSGSLYSWVAMYRCE